MIAFLIIVAIIGTAALMGWIDWRKDQRRCGGRDYSTIDNPAIKNNFQKFAEGYKVSIKKFNDTIDIIMKKFFELIFKLIQTAVVIVLVIIMFVIVATVMNSCNMIHPD